MFGLLLMSVMAAVYGMYWLIERAAELEQQRAEAERERLNRIMRASHDLSITKGPRHE